MNDHFARLMHEDRMALLRQEADAARLVSASPPNVRAVRRTRVVAWLLAAAGVLGGRWQALH